MPKIPTFTAQGSIEQLAGTTTNIQMNLNNNLATALAPVTNTIVNEKIKQNDTQNRTEALRLGNEFTRELQTIEDTIANDSTGLGVNKQSANAYYKEKTNNLIDKFKLQSSNNATATLFTNNALSAVNRGIFRIDNVVDKNVFLDLQNQVEQAETSLITQALFNNKDSNVVDEFGIKGNVNDFDYATLETNLTKLYTDAYSGKIPAANLNKIINNIPSLVQGFQANKDIYDNPSFAYTELNKGENSSVYPDLKVEQRTKLINKVKTMMVQPLQKDFANVIFSLQDKGTEQPFDFNFAKQILPAEKYNELKTTYDLAKINAEDVRLIRTLPLNEADDLIESKNYNTDLYVGSADRITQAKLKEGLINVRNNVVKQMKIDPVQFQIETSPEIAELVSNYENETNPEIKLVNRKILTDAIIDDQIRRGAELDNLKILTKQEVNQIKDQFLNTSVTSEDKLKLIEQLKVTYGYENMGMIVNHLQDEKTSETILMAISTDSVELAKDLFDSSTLKELKTLAAQKDIDVDAIKKLIAKETEDFGQVLDSQGEGSESKAAKMLRINEALLKAALVRTNKNVSVEDAVESASNDFLNDYVINESLTALIPKKINNIDIPVVAALNKSEAILIGLKDTSQGNYLDRFMGEDGYMHYASSLNIPNVSEEEVKKRIGFTIRNYSRWLNNSDMTGMVLYADFGSAGLQPVRNSNGQRIEFYLTDLPNQDPTIKDTISVYPVTNDPLPLIPDPPSDDYFQYDENLIDETIIDEKKNSKFPVDEQSKTDFSFFTKVAAGEATLEDKALANPDLKKRIKKHEGEGKDGLYVPYVDSLGNLTVGHGHKLPKGSTKKKYTKKEIDNFFEEDMKIATKRVNKLGELNLINLNTIDQNAYDILVEMALNMGSNPNAKGKEKKGLFGFKKTLEAIKNGEYKLASEHMLYNFKSKDYKDTSKKIGKTDWYKQVKETRAMTLKNLMASIEEKSQLTNESP